jgi:hypothetical protein
MRWTLSTAPAREGGVQGGDEVLQNSKALKSLGCSLLMVWTKTCPLFLRRGLRLHLHRAGQDKVLAECSGPTGRETLAQG